MSRLSDNEIVNGVIRNGYDYKNQCWIENYIVIRCGHPVNLNCKCFGRLNADKDIREVK